MDPLKALRRSFGWPARGSRMFTLPGWKRWSSTGVMALSPHVEEWKKASFPHLSDTLLVVVTFLFDRLIPVYGASVKDGRRYDGRIAPQNIGRRKDFWYRLTLAYRDLLIQEVLSQDKRKKNTTPEAFVDRYFHALRRCTTTDCLLIQCVSQAPGLNRAGAGGDVPCGIVTGSGN